MSLAFPLGGRPFAHRGLWRRGGPPENSLAAFEAACAAGYGIELDVRLTADGEAVVFHDDGLERMTVDSGLVEERTVDELAAMTLLGGDHQHIPTLAEALAIIAARSPVLVELKTPPGQEGMLEACVAPLLETYAGQSAALSFNASALAWLARRHPSVPRGLNADTVEGLRNIDLAKADFLSVHLDLAEKPEVQSWRANGGSVIAWTVRRDADRKALAGLTENFIFECLHP